MIISDAIKKTTLFQGIDPDTARDLAAHCRQKNLSKGQDLFSVGDRADCFFVILKGWIKLYRISRDGSETIIHVFGPGESFAEAAVFNDGRTYPVNAQSIEDSILIEIPRSFFVRKIEENSQFALHMLGAIASRQHFLVQQIEQVTSRTAPQRIGVFLLRFCRRTERAADGSWIVELPYDKSLISTRLNIKPETFSRALAKLEPYGVAVGDRRRICITDIDRLAEFCDVPPGETPC